MLPFSGHVPLCSSDRRGCGVSFLSYLKGWPGALVLHAAVAFAGFERAYSHKQTGQGSFGFGIAYRLYMVVYTLINYTGVNTNNAKQF